MQAAGAAPNLSRWIRSPWVHVAALLLAVIAAYHHTLDVPFYLDDFSSIRENPAVHTWQGLGAVWAYHPLRFLTYLTFAWNYAFGGFDPGGYHVTNIAIHWLAGVAVYALVRGLLRTPRVGDAGDSARLWLPLFAAALFVLHPLQTQAVTYIVQRLASMVALFYIAAMGSYVQARLAEARPQRAAWGALALLFTLLAFFTKQNSATLPLAFLLLEAACFRTSLRRLVTAVAAGFAGLAVVWVLLATAYGFNPFDLSAVDPLTRQATSIPRHLYFATQLANLWIYVKLFVLPVGLHLDYTHDLATGLFEPRILLSAAAHVAMIALAIRSWKRAPLIAFGMLFYYLAHGVESSILPIWELVFEYRSYLPNVGLCVIAGWLLFVVLPRRGAGRIVPVVAILILATLGVLTWQRNAVWRSPVALWRDNVVQAPTKPRAWSILGKHLLEADSLVASEAAFRRAVALRKEGHGSADVNAVIDVVNLSENLRLQGRPEEALVWLDEHESKVSDPALRSKLMLARGHLLFDTQQMNEAEAAFREAITLDPSSLPVRSSLAAALATGGRFDEAEQLYAEVLQVDPQDGVAREGLLQTQANRLVSEGNAHQRAGNAAEARSAYRGALAALEELIASNPDNAAAQSGVQTLRQVLGP